MTPKVEWLILIVLFVIMGLIALTWWNVDDYKLSTEKEKQGLRDSMQVILDQVAGLELQVDSIKTRMDSVVLVKQKVIIRYEAKIDSIRFNPVSYSDSIILSKIR